MGKKYRVAIIGIRGIPANYGGFETCAEKTAERFVNDYDVYVFCRKHNCTICANTYKGVKLVKLPSLNFKSLDTISHTFLCTLYLLFRPSIKIVHLYNTANAIFIPLLKLFGKKVLISVDGLEWKRLKWGKVAKNHYKFSEYLCSKTADVIIADSGVIRRYYQEKFNVNPVYIPYGADQMEVESEDALEKYGLEKKEYFLFVGRLVPDKGVHNLIKAFRQLDTSKHLVIIGDDNAYIDYIDTLKKMSDERVKFLGYVYGNEYTTLNKHTFCYVSASLIEGTSPALVNAMGAGNCILVNGIAENIETLGGTGLYYKENDADDLANHMNDLLRNPEKIIEIGIKTKARADILYNWDMVAKQYMEIFEKLL